MFPVYITLEGGRTLYRYVDWNSDRDSGKQYQLVVPYIGTWIETSIFTAGKEESHVVPYIGTWIETIRPSVKRYEQEVVPYIGTWIETVWKNIYWMQHNSRTLYRYVDWNW